MKLCTIIDQDDTPLPVFGRPLSDAARRAFRGERITAMLLAVESLANTYDRSLDGLIWGNAHDNPLRLQLVCDDEFSDILRFYLPTLLPALVEIDVPVPSKPHGPAPS